MRFPSTHHQGEIMEKLKLEIDTLAVQSFATESLGKAAPGTVQGRDASSPGCPGFSWPWTGCTGCSCDEVCVTPAC